MRKILLTMLLASAVATPVLAQNADADRWRETRRVNDRDVRDSRREVQESRRQVEDGKRDVRDAMARGDQREARQEMRELRRDRAELERNKAELRQDVRDARQERYRDRDRDWRREGNRDWDRNDRGTWRRDWRNDQRYDWSRWRNQNRERFHAPRYWEPRNYSYHRWSIGIRIDPFFFGNRYWINDPDYYRLPPAYGPYRWVRYYDDVMLVDVRSGLIVDIIYDFFW